ncbi:hypothetical protein CRG49_011145 [Neisseria sp. N95_16]|uniref:DUF2752 domain-containing protein n=1 Tax=Neisseria brasiliensis TaxID=2666100 RepID=A0A5Q3S2A4_9NEIS|nr:MULTISPECIES: hypothetical protein [Neisseria]MRN38960.1 hypothetical protein [Neisseria brasiliensis]MRN39159.1 hypothetical protein [Neisseria brasiliensis]PJO08778.1 hypothetical protein CRG49_011145 [Neisseria sp. N95_16]PJO78442.1 hypothetical protein CWC45_05080 [Neisseria sp. N177_16]QGL26065.1 hypothetical protein GJV52_11300 [Neisseria brasiliensis]
MICRCPNCGAVNSLDSLVNDASAAEIMKMFLGLDADISQVLIRYIGLFRPAKNQLSWGRTEKLMKELLLQIQTATIERDGTAYAAPLEAWLYALHEVLAAREAGRLKTPLKSHGYLYEIIAGWQGQGGAVSTAAQHIHRAAPPAKASQTLTAAASLQGLKK